MRRLLVTSILTALAAMTAAVAVSADAVYHSEHLRLRPIGEAPLRSGFVENIHADGPNVYAHEQYVLNGAAPNSSYQVVLMIFPTDTTCSSSSPSIPVPTATITTNAAGNGNAFHVFAPADADGLRGLTVGGMWLVMSGATVAYETACTTIHLD